MHVAHLLLIVVFFVAATACIITANVIFYQIWDEVNSKRPAEQQFSFIFVNVRAFEITGEHARLFPDSQKRKLMYTWAGVGFAIGLIAFLSGATR